MGGSDVKEAGLGVKYGITMSEPPRSRVGMKNAAPAWLSGVQMRNRRSSGHSHSAIWMAVMVASAPWSASL